MKSIRTYSLLLVFSLLYLHGSTQELDSRKILFVGNSYTYFWNLPQTVQGIATYNEKTWMVRQSTAGGASWKDHWDGEKDLKTREIIDSQDWDIVVIQNHSMSAIEDLEGFMNYGEKLIESIRAKGAEPILYVTWARSFDPLMQDQINRGYKKLAEKTNARMVPAGQVWEYVTMLRPDLQLYDKDDSHPSPLGTYLNACVFYKVLTGVKTLEIERRITSEDMDGEKIYLAIVPPNDAAFVQRAIDKYFEDFVNNN